MPAFRREARGLEVQGQLRLCKVSVMPVWATLKYKVCLGEGSVLELSDNSKMSQ